MGTPDSGAGRKMVQISVYTHERLVELAIAYQQDERLTNRPTFDDVIRRLLAARDQLAGQYGGQP